MPQNLKQDFQFGDHTYEKKYLKKQKVDTHTIVKYGLKLVLGQNEY